MNKLSESVDFILGDYLDPPESGGKSNFEDCCAFGSERLLRDSKKLKLLLALVIHQPMIEEFKRFIEDDENQ